MYLPAEGPLWSQKEVLSQLLGQCASALDHSAGHEILHAGARHADKIDAPMRVKILIFDRGDRIFDNLRDLFPGDDNPALQSERSDHTAVIGVDLGNEAGMIILQRTHLRQITVVHKQNASRSANCNSQTEQKHEDQRTQVTP